METMNNCSEQIDQIAAALAEAQTGMTFAPKTATASMGTAGKRSYADLADVIEAVRPHLSRVGIAYLHTTQTESDGKTTVTCKLAHKSGQWLASSLSLPPDRMGGIQGMGSAITYARRYTLAALCGIAQDDDDGEASQEAYRKAQKQEVAETRRKAKAENTDIPSDQLRKKFFAVANEVYPDCERDAMLFNLSEFFGRNIQTSSQLTAQDMKTFIDVCEGNKEHK